MKKTLAALLLAFSSSIAFLYAKDSPNFDYEAPALEGAVIVDQRAITGSQALSLEFYDYMDLPLSVKAYVNNPSTKEWVELGTQELKGFGDKVRVKTKNKALLTFFTWRYFAFVMPNAADCKYTVEMGKIDQFLKIKFYHNVYDESKLNKVGLAQKYVPYKLGAISAYGEGAEDHIIVTNKSSKDLSATIYAFDEKKYKWFPVAASENLKAGTRSILDCEYDGKLDKFKYFAFEEASGKKVSVEMKEDKDDLLIIISD